jgi:hypothetical protein
VKTIPVIDVQVGDKLVNLGSVIELEDYIPETVTVVTKDKYKNRVRLYIPNDQQVVLV